MIFLLEIDPLYALGASVFLSVGTLLLGIFSFRQRDDEMRAKAEQSYVDRLETRVEKTYERAEKAEERAEKAEKACEDCELREAAMVATIAAAAVREKAMVLREEVMQAEINELRRRLEALEH